MRRQSSVLTSLTYDTGTSWKLHLRDDRPNLRVIHSSDICFRVVSLRHNGALLSEQVEGAASTINWPKSGSSREAASCFVSATTSTATGPATSVFSCASLRNHRPRWHRHDILAIPDSWIFLIVAGMEQRITPSGLSAAATAAGAHCGEPPLLPLPTRWQCTSTSAKRLCFHEAGCRLGREPDEPDNARSATSDS